MNSGKPSYPDPKPDSNHLYTLTIDNPNDNPDPESVVASLLTDPNPKPDSNPESNDHPIITL